MFVVGDKVKINVFVILIYLVKAGVFLTYVQNMPTWTAGRGQRGFFLVVFVFVLACDLWDSTFKWATIAPFHIVSIHYSVIAVQLDSV